MFSTIFQKSVKLKFIFFLNELFENLLYIVFCSDFSKKKNQISFYYQSVPYPNTHICTQLMLYLLCNKLQKFMMRNHVIKKLYSYNYM